MRRRSKKYVLEGSKYAHWIGLYLRFHLNWVLGLFVHGRLQNLQTSEVTFVHVITPLRTMSAYSNPTLFNFFTTLSICHEPAEILLVGLPCGW